MTREFYLYEAHTNGASHREVANVCSDSLRCSDFCICESNSSSETVESLGIGIIRGIQIVLAFINECSYQLGMQSNKLKYYQLKINH